MKPGKHPLVVQIDKRFDIKITWRDHEGDPMDLTGCHARLKSSILPELSDAPGEGITLGGGDGVVRISMAKEATAELERAEGEYELTIEMEDGESVMLLGGSVEVL